MRERRKKTTTKLVASFALGFISLFVPFLYYANNKHKQNRTENKVFFGASHLIYPVISFKKTLIAITLTLLYKIIG